MPRKTRSSWGSNKPARRKGYRTLRYWADEHDGRGYMRHTKTIEGSKRDGDHELARIRLAHAEDKPVPTVRDCYETWYLPDVEKRLSPSSLRLYKSAWNSKIAPRWADVLVTDVKVLDIEEWLSDFTVSQARLSMRLLPVILDYAVRYEIIDRNPARVRIRMPTDIERRDRGTYSLDEALAIFGTCEGSHCEAAVLSSLFASCRVGESLSPMVSELVEERASNGIVAARFDLVRQMGNDRHIHDALKTKTSARPIIFVGKVAERMLAIRNRTASEGLMWLSDNGLGDPLTQDDLNKEWRNIVKNAGLDYHLFKNLRNSWRTFMEWELHIDADKLEKMMGHVGHDVTAVHYNRPTTQMLIDAVAEAYERKGVLI